MSHTRNVYIASTIAVILIGVASRMVTTGFPLFDKYLGDALYAVLFYLALRLIWAKQSRREHANWAMILVFAIELFQLTGIPLAMRQSDNSLLALVSILLGTHFSWLDIVAYAVGILVFYWIDLTWNSRP